MHIPDLKPHPLVMCLLPAQVAEIEAAEKSKMREKCEAILANNINCFINRQLIYNYPEEIFADAGELHPGLGVQCSDIRNEACDWI